MKKIKVLLYFLLGLSLSLFILTTSIHIKSFDINYYMNSFKENNIETVTNMDEENLRHVAKDLIKYLKDDRAKLDTTAVIKGDLKPVYGEREILHMIDVKALFKLSQWIKVISAIVAIGTLLILFKMKALNPFYLGKTLMITVGINLSLLLILVLLMQSDFTQYFTYFHEIFFTNDLWLLDPETEVLIQMLPEIFFIKAAIGIGLYYGTSLLLMMIIGFLLYKRKREKYII